MTTRARKYGFTLIEVMVSTIIMSIVMVALMLVFLAVQRSYEAISRSKTAMEGSRAAVAFVERQLRLAGYGIDPVIAFDMNDAPASAGGGKDNVAVNIAGETVTIVTDDLTFRYRDPNWARRGAVNSGGSTLTLEALDNLPGTFDIALAAGRRVLVMCPSGQGYGVYQLGANVSAGNASVGVAKVTTAPFPSDNPGCLTSTGDTSPWVFVLQERRIRIREVDSRPFLVVYDRAGAVGPDEFDVIAADVEDFQVAYVMNRQPLNSGISAVAPVGGDWLLGNDEADLPNHSPVGEPDQDQPYDSAERYTANAANIRSVRVSLVTRSRFREAGKLSSAPYSLENHTRTSPPLDGFTRLLTTTTVRIPNMLSRTSFTPDHKANPDEEGNFNGG